jgi:hypothetical protein
MFWSIDNLGVYESPKTLTVQIASLDITTNSPLPDARYGEFYSTQLDAVGGTQPYVWSWIDGQLPSGLHFDESDATISGIPTAPGAYDFSVQAQDSSATPRTETKTFRITVIPVKPSLTIQSSDLTFDPANPAPGQPVMVTAMVSNNGLSEATNVKVSLYEFNALLGDDIIPSLGVNQNASVTFNTTFESSDMALITVEVDPDNTIAELDESDNQASQLLMVGVPDPSQATIVVQAPSASTCQGSVVAITGRADYDFASIPGQQDYPVQGGSVTVALFDPATSEMIGTFTGSHTNVSGAFNQTVIAPANDGSYPVTISITDKTITQETQTNLVVSGACPAPMPAPFPGPDNPVIPPGETRDVYLSSEDIFFSNANPEKSEPIQILAYIHYYGAASVSDIPVTVNDIFPESGVLKTVEIANTQVSFPGGGSSNIVAVSVPWANSLEGAHVIQVVVAPPFSQYEGNDKATRAIFVGSLPQIEISKSWDLLTDADGNGKVSPGDSLSYALAYKNTGSAEVTGAIILDDYDETLLQIPTNISSGGAVSDGVITWNLGNLPAGTTGSVTYQVTLQSREAFPSGKSALINDALLTTDQTPPVAARVELEVISNMPPTVDANGPYPVDEGSTATLTAIGSDPDGDALAYAWDLDNDGEFETPGQSITFSAEESDGPGSRIVAVQVTDPGGLSATDQATVTIENVPPTVEVGPDITIDEGGTFSSSGSFDDPGILDTWTATVDYGDGSDPETLALNMDKTFALSHVYADNGSYTVVVTVDDKDSGEGTDTATVTVNNMPPTVGPISATAEPVQVGTLVTASANFTDPGVLDTHTAIWDWGDGSVTPGMVTETDGSGSISDSHSYSTPGVYTLKLTVTDKDGGVGEAIYRFAVVYDPSGGFVTGGGWIMSPDGACPDFCAGAIGKANFGFVSKYQTGADTLTGQTEFQFKAGDLNFHSNSYDWMVVAGARAKYKGEGTINGEGDYGFMLTATDAALTPSTDVDLFRIKIWDKATDNVVYDNKMGANDDEYDGTEIGGGNIKVHKAE